MAGGAGDRAGEVSVPRSWGAGGVSSPDMTPLGCAPSHEGGIQVNRLLKALVAFAAVAIAPGTALANGVRTHDGFFLRLEPGLAYARGTTIGDRDETLKGVGSHLSISIGGALTENLILAGNVFATATSEPDYEERGVDREVGDLTAGFSGVGPQLTWYFMPANVYVSGTAGLGSLTIESDVGDSESVSGFATRLAVGKEWWVSNNWGLGLGGHAVFARTRQEDGGGRWRTWSFGVTFSATYN